MTRSSFLILYARYTIAPEVALENPALVAALKARNDAEVERILREGF